jgi:hypothetical protein
MTELPAPHTAENMARMGAVMEALIERGAMLGGEGLRPSREGARVRYQGRERTVIDGPFTETKELIAGYILMRGTKAEAIELAERWAEVHVDAEAGKTLPECVIEIRRLAETAHAG